MNTRCSECGDRILVMIFRADGVCSDDCRKARDRKDENDG